MSGRHQIWISLLAILVAVLSMIPLEVQHRIVDEVVADRNLDLLVVLGGVYLAILLGQGGCKLALRLYQGRLSESAIRYNREHLAQIYACRAAGAQTPDKGDAKGQAVSVIGTEIDRLGGFVEEGLSQPVVSGGMLLAIVGYMLVVKPLVALFSLVFLVPQVVLVPLVQRFINRLMKERVTLIRSIRDNLAELPRDCQDMSEVGLTEQLDGIYGNRMRMFLYKFALKALVNFLNALERVFGRVLSGDRRRDNDRRECRLRIRFRKTVCASEGTDRLPSRCGSGQRPAHNDCALDVSGGKEVTILRLTNALVRHCGLQTAPARRYLLTCDRPNGKRATQ